NGGGMLGKGEDCAAEQGGRVAGKGAVEDAQLAAVVEDRASIPLFHVVVGDQAPGDRQGSALIPNRPPFPSILHHAVSPQGTVSDGQIHVARLNSRARTLRSV